MDRSQCFDEVQPVRLVWSIDVATIQSRVRDAYHVKAVLSTSTVMSRFNCLVNDIHLSIYKYSSYPPFENKNNTIIERLAEGEKKEYTLTSLKPPPEITITTYVHQNLS